MFPPVPHPSRDDTMYSVTVELPPHLEAELSRYVEADEMTSKTLLIHEALYVARATMWSQDALLNEVREKIDRGLQDLDSGRTVEVTPAYWERFRQQAERSLQAIRALQAQGHMGNLLLPVELYDFIAARIAAGAGETPTDIICAALPLLRQERHRSGAGTHT